MSNDPELAARAATDAKRSWQLAADAFEQRLGCVGPGDLDKPTPCAEWNVRSLVEHTIDTQIRYGARLGYDMGDDRRWEAVRARMEHGLGGDEELATTTIQHSALGETSRLYVLGIVTNDLLVHTWDLARAIGVDDTLPSEAVDACLAVVEQAPATVVRGPQVWGDKLRAVPGSGAQARLLAAVGRPSIWPHGRDAASEATP